ncbi:helix-turn-helix domain-containing protein [Brevundimonas sp.]|uniref:helix-turn-helix domain-containing protein n=1 Tax=Brevundimonas sp. TaxID=1871086 RepID=UPI0035ADCE9E
MNQSAKGEAAPATCIVVSPEMTILIGRGPLTATSAPSDAIGVAYGLGSIKAPARLELAAQDGVDAMLSTDTGAARIVLLVADAALARIRGLTRPSAGATEAFHLPTDLRAIALSLRDCDLGGEAGSIYCTAKGIELLFETWRRLDQAALAPLAGDSALSEADSLRLVQARALIDEHCRQKLSLDAIARSCGLNREKLTRGFREMFDCTVAEAIAQRRLERASQMLLTTDLPVSSIGYESGYLNNASFARAFGRRYGQSPSDYRASRLAA